MKRLMMLVLTLGLAAAPVARGQDGAAADLRVLSAVVGVGTARITDIGVPDRTMRGLNVRADVHILSLLFRGLPIRTYDALTGDVTYGRRTSDSLPGLFAADKEGTNGFQATFGYQFLAGGELHGVAILGGLGRQQHYYDIGGTTLDGSSVPAIARVEIGARRRIVVTAWHSVSGDATTGGRVDVPFFRRLNLTAMYWTAAGLADVWSSSSSNKIPAHGRMLVVGVRTAEL